MKRIMRWLGVSGLVLSTFGSAAHAAPGDCSGTVTTTLFGKLDSSGSHYQCNSTCTTATPAGRTLIDCNVGGGSGGALAYAVYDGSETLCGSKYCIFGDDEDGNAFCCAEDSSSGSGDYNSLTLKGGGGDDALAFYFSDVVTKRHRRAPLGDKTEAGAVPRSLSRTRNGALWAGGDGVDSVHAAYPSDDAVDEIEAAGPDGFADRAEYLLLEIENTIWNSGIDCSTDARYDVVMVTPDRIRKDGEPVTDDLLATGASTSPYDVVFDNIEDLTDIPGVQSSLSADVVLVMVGWSFPEATEYFGTYVAGKADQICEGDGSSDNEDRKWVAYYWGFDTTGPHELGHLLGARHDPEADELCGTGPFDANCGFADDTEDVGSIMAYYSSCDDTCDRRYIFSNPYRTTAGYSTMMGDTYQYNACVVFSMWDYTSLTSDAYHDYVTAEETAIDSSAYSVAYCPEL